MPPKFAGKRKATAPPETPVEAKKPKTSSSNKTSSSLQSQQPQSGPMALALRTPISSLSKRMYIGAHVSMAGGVQNAVPNSVHVGGNAFALFLKSQRRWTSAPLSTESHDAFHENIKKHGYSYDHILPHGSYLVNLAQEDPVKATQAYDCLLDDLNRCERLGIKLYNLHPGSTGGAARDEAIVRISDQLNRVHAATSSVVTVVENMAGGGNTVGATFEDLGDIITRVDDKSRIGVCIDTCHAFAAGYDMRTPVAFEQTMKEFDSVVGMQYLKALHLNDSKAPLASHRDMHANIGTGFLGLRAFHSVVNNPDFEGLPMVLETPIDRMGPKGKREEDKQVWADEIKLLESLIGMDAESDGFKTLEEKLSNSGADERKKFQEQADRKIEKAAKSEAKKRKAPVKTSGKNKKNKVVLSEEEAGEQCDYI